MLAEKAAAAAKAGTSVEIEVEGSQVTTEELLGVQQKIFAILYKMDQTPIQAEMPTETTLAKSGAKDVRVATGGKAFSCVSRLKSRKPLSNAGGQMQAEINAGGKSEKRIYEVIFF